MKNTTLGRKASNTMKAGEGKYLPKTAKNQRGDGADFAFNGQMGDGVNRMSDRGVCANPMAHMVKNPDSINHGMKASSRRGNHSDQSVDRMEKVGPSATKDGLKMTIATASEGHNIGRETAPRGFKNPDAINVGNK